MGVGRGWICVCVDGLMIEDSCCVVDCVCVFRMSYLVEIFVDLIDEVCCFMVCNYFSLLVWVGSFIVKGGGC